MPEALVTTDKPAETVVKAADPAATTVVDKKTEPVVVADAKATEKTDAQKAQEAETTILTKVAAEPKEVVYDLKAPKDFPAEEVAEITAFAKANKLSSESAQMILEREAAKIAAHKAQTTKWMDDVRADKEIGGDKFAESSDASAKFVEKYGDKELFEALNKTGLGNFPPLVRIFARAGALMKEGTIANGNPPPAKDTPPATFAEALASFKPQAPVTAS